MNQIQSILKSIRNGHTPGYREILELFTITRDDDLAALSETAFALRKEHGNTIKLTSTIHITNQCSVTPKCRYCGFAAGTSPSGYFYPFFKTDEEILTAARTIEKAGIPRVSCSGAHGYGGAHAANAARLVKGNTSLELLVNVGSDLTEESIRSLARLGTDTVCCNLETTNATLFNTLKPGETLHQRVRVCEMVEKQGLELSSGLLIGVGESYEDRIRHLAFLRTFTTLGEIPIMGFNPYSGTPMEKYPACSLQEQVKTIAITRILFPGIRITVPTPTIGPENLKYPLLAGADNVATVIPDNYPLSIKGVGSPVYGSLESVVKIIHAQGLVLQSHPDITRHTTCTPTPS